MIKLYFWIILFTLGIFAQETTYRNVPTTLRECYESKYLLEKDYRLPHTLNTLIAILQKIENAKNLNMDLRALTVGIMHRFRQDGVEKNPNVVEQSGVLPYRAGAQAQKYLQIARFIPKRTDNIPSYNMLTAIERCTLHFMLSSSIEMLQREDENTACRYADNAYRIARSVTGNYPLKTNLDVHDDVETLSPEQINVITNNKHGVTEHAVDPNAMYPELPPNHPKIARYSEQPLISKCPVENGVIKTTWGPVSAGPLIAGIAAGLQPEIVTLSELFPDEKDPNRKRNLSILSLDNKWIATVAGDLAEVTLIQGPITNGPKNNKLSVGVNGNWNSSTMPHWYFLQSNKNLEFTTAEIRGDIDGFILAGKIEDLYSKVPRLRLSQILDLYYSPRGLFNSVIRACNRKTFFQTLISKETLTAQTYCSSLVLEEYLHRATISDDKMKNFAKQATEELARYIEESMNKDLSCHETETGFHNDIIQVAIDLTIILDTTWPFIDIQPILADILDNIKINPYNSQFTIMNGGDGSIMLNTTNSILDFGYFNMTNYTNGISGFDLPKSLEQLHILQKKKLNDERSSFGHGKSDVVLIIPFTTTLSETDKQYCKEKIKTMREKVPDATLLILTYGTKDRWTELVRDPANDLFSTSVSGDIGSSIAIANLISRIKQVPQRLINTRCGADYSPAGSTNSFIDYIEPNTVVSYRMHPNYFFSTDNDYVAKIKIEGSGWGNLKVCRARHFININATNINCESINNNELIISTSCRDASLIHLCDPQYLLIVANTLDNSSITNFQCSDPAVCRFPHMIKYTISYENLVCESNANINMLNIFVLIISTLYTFL
ncbi:uncharacterized protein LOC105836104 [Monomorium pharaonis]|uniref:uncharacterized protein LOC105836104 n=1 Tax=Monomorium pharaonis TaxID=307658 RepID=UPI0017472CAE|nr:uncharacterized protein LOC105836104 [Monomorium pharaonis]